MARQIVRMAPMRRIAVSNHQLFPGTTSKDFNALNAVKYFVVSIAPLAADLLQPEPLVPYLSRFHSAGYAVFSEKGVVGKLCAEGLEGDAKLVVRQTVSESLCKSLGYE